MIEIKTPELAESITEASLLEWQKQPGDAVAEGETLVVVETDKIALEVPAPHSGVLAEILKPEGAQVTSGEPIAMLDETAQGAAAPAPAPVSAATPAPVAAAGAPVMPAARKIAAEQGVNPAEISGTGKGGRITKGDVLAAAQSSHSRGASPSSATGEAALRKTHSQAALGNDRVGAALGNDRVGAALGNDRVGALGNDKDRGERRVPMTKLRARIAERLLESQRETASLTTFNEADMSAVIKLRGAHRDAFAEKHGVKLGFMSFFVRAAAAALRQFPVVNASVDGGEIVYHDHCDIGVAVGTPRGLVVPILRNAESMSFAGIESAIADFGARAQTGALSLDEISGGTFTITNGGVFGSMLSTPIINPPQSAILGVHATKERPVAENGQVVVRPLNYLALSYDHRIIDGREAVLFLAAVKGALEDPARMLLDL